jgi:predicted nuclease of predicted toxin-antitoxin system
VSIRFLADADLNQAIVKGVREREPALDLMSATEGLLEGLSDPDVLAFATAENRILISHDTSAMPVHFVKLLGMGGHSPGILLVRQRASLGQIIDAILILWSASAPEEWIDQIHYLPSFSRHIFQR